MSDVGGLFPAQAGARLTRQSAEQLVGLLEEWKARHAEPEDCGEPSDDACEAATATAGLATSANSAGSVRVSMEAPARASGTDLMVLPADPFQPAGMWALAMPPKGKRTPNWELSLEKFEKSKQSIDGIAMNQENGTALGAHRSRQHALVGLALICGSSGSRARKCSWHKRSHRQRLAHG